jgi:hypothetical protein
VGYSTVFVFIFVPHHKIRLCLWPKHIIFLCFGPQHKIRLYAVGHSKDFGSVLWATAQKLLYAVATVQNFYVLIVRHSAGFVYAL